MDLGSPDLLVSSALCAAGGHSRSSPEPPSSMENVDVVSIRRTKALADLRK